MVSLAAEFTAEFAGVLAWRAALGDLQARLGRLFVRPEPRRQAGLYLEGLLSAAQRKNGWQVAEQIGDARPWRTQRVLSHVLWDEDAARDLCRTYVVQHLAADDAVLVLDETGFLKKGTKSAGVARQYSGSAGRIENCQIGVFLGYASQYGQALSDRDLYLPKAWTEDRARCAAAAVPADVPFASKPELARRMIDRARAAKVPFRWVVGDELYGNDRRLRVWLEQNARPHVLAVKATEPLWAWVDGQGRRQVAAQDLVAGVAAADWQRLSAGPGAKGERWDDGVRVRLFRLPQPPWEHWLLARPSRAKPDEIAFPDDVVFGPADTTLQMLARVAGQRWTIETCFEVAKQEVGLADYEVRITRCEAGTAGTATSPWRCWRWRSWPGGAPRCSANRVARPRPRRPARSYAVAVQSARSVSPISQPELRRLMAHLQHRAGRALNLILGWSLWRRLHQALAKACHWKRRAALLPLPP